jgi:hypothetical protein
VYFPRIIQKSGLAAFEAQCIPTDPAVLGAENYKAFLQQRRELVAQRLNEFLEGGRALSGVSEQGCNP